MSKFNKTIMKQTQTEGKEKQSTETEGKKISVGAGLLSPTSVSASPQVIKEMQTVYIKLSDMYPSEDNTISMDETEIEELAESLLMVGMLNPPIVKRDEQEKYRIVCGEKRYRATLLNIKKGRRPESEPLKCNLFDPKLIDLKLSDDEKEDLVRDEENALQRNKTDADKLMLIRKYEERFKILKEREPERFKGMKTRAFLAQSLGMSGSAIAQFKKVENQGDDSLIQAIEDKKVNISTAVDIAGLQKIEQKELIEKALSAKPKDGKISQADVLQYKHGKKSETSGTEAPKVETAKAKASGEIGVDAECAGVENPENTNTMIDEKQFKKDMKEIFKTLRTRGGVTLDEKQYFTYLKTINQLEKILK